MLVAKYSHGYEAERDQYAAVPRKTGKENTMTTSDMRDKIEDFKSYLNTFRGEVTSFSINDVCYFLDKNLDELDNLLSAAERADSDNKFEVAQER